MHDPTDKQEDDNKKRKDFDANGMPMLETEGEGGRDVQDKHAQTPTHVCERDPCKDQHTHERTGIENKHQSQRERERGKPDFASLLCVSFPFLYSVMMMMMMMMIVRVV